MTKKMLIDASHPEETRVVIVDGNRVEELDFESRNKRQLRGNVYLARVTRVEPSLQAAFVEFGGNRHGFLAFSEIHPDYYQIPFEDRMALIEAEEAENRAEEEEEEEEAGSDTAGSDELNDEDTPPPDNDNEEADDEDDSEDADEEDDEDNTDEIEDVVDEDEIVENDDDEEVAQEQAKTASTRQKRMSRRRYKIQEVIKRGQILLIQAVKEERGNKGAAMTTYLSLAGRYCVLMPNTPRGGGISRKIANGSDRKRLKAIMSDLPVPQGMGVIVRTAGAKRTKAEIKRDYDYLSRLWETIRENTLKSIAPSLIHEEGNLVKRSIRDLYNKDISEVLVEGEDAYKTAKSFIKMLMPSHAKNVKAYKDEIPLFLRYNVERQIEDSLKSVVQLKSGGYLVIHPTEALVSVDVNSGRSTKERNVERTALKTNLEAAEEVARQMRLRDLAGLIVIDFIDMDEFKNNRSVERRMKEALASDRARVQTSRISQFGLMEISRQRRRRSLLEGSTAHCEHCEGVGRKRTIESSALSAIRAVEELGVRGKSKRARLRVSTDVALYLFNEKRSLLSQVEDSTGMFTEVVGDESLLRPAYEIDIVEKSGKKGADPLEEIEKEFRKQRKKDDKKPQRRKSKRDSDEDLDDSDSEQPRRDSVQSEDEDQGSRKKRRRRGRRGGRGKRRDEQKNDQELADQNQEEPVELAANDGNNAGKETDEAVTTEDDQPKSRGRKRSTRKAPARKTQKEEDHPTDEQESEDKKKAAPKRKSRRKAPARIKQEKDAVKTDVSTEQDDVPKEASQKSEQESSDDVKTETNRRSTARRKAPARKKTGDDADNAGSDDEKPVKKARRKAPAKKKAEEQIPAEDGTKAAKKKPAGRRKAPAKKSENDDSAIAQSEEKKAEEKPKSRSTSRRKAPSRK